MEMCIELDDLEMLAGWTNTGLGKAPEGVRKLLRQYEEHVVAEGCAVCKETFETLRIIERASKSAMEKVLNRLIREKKLTLREE